MGYGAAIGAAIGLGTQFLSSKAKAEQSKELAKAEGVRTALQPLLGGRTGEPVRGVDVTSETAKGGALGAFRGAQFEADNPKFFSPDATPPAVDTSPSTESGAGFAGQVANQSVGIPDTKSARKKRLDEEFLKLLEEDKEKQLIEALQAPDEGI